MVVIVLLTILIALELTIIMSVFFAAIDEMSKMIKMKEGDEMQTIDIYTDGSCLSNPGPGGWAFAIPQDEHIYTEHGYELETTNNRMEMYSVIAALSYAHKRGIKSVCIYSDSAYVVNAINKCWLINWRLNGWKTKTDKSVKNQDLWQQIDKLTNTLDVKFVKVKGHAGNPMNELVDEHARSEAVKAYRMMGVK